MTNAHVVDDGSEQLGAVVVGTGFGVLTHLRALRAAGIAVHALVGRDAERTARKAALSDVPVATTDLAAALAIPWVDVVAVATPPFTHAPIVLDAVAAGKHVVCEKPFAREVAEARRMRDAADDAGVVHLLGTEFRYGTGQALLARTIAAGEIGTPRMALFALEVPSLTDPAAELPAWWEDAAQGGGWLGAYGSHVVDQIRSTLGDFEAVSASLQTLAPRPAMTADDTYTVQFRLTSGVEGVMHSSCAVGGQFVAATKIAGTAGTAWLEGDDVWVDSGTGPRRVPVPDDLVAAAPSPPPAELLHTAYDMWHSMGIDLDPYTKLYRALRERVAGRAVADDPAPATFDDGVAVQAVMDAIHVSARERAWTSVS